MASHLGLPLCCARAAGAERARGDTVLPRTTRGSNMMFMGGGRSVKHTQCVLGLQGPYSSRQVHMRNVLVTGDVSWRSMQYHKDHCLDMTVLTRARGMVARCSNAEALWSMALCHVSHTGIGGLWRARRAAAAAGPVVDGPESVSVRIRGPDLCRRCTHQAGASARCEEQTQSRFMNIDRRRMPVHDCCP